MRFAKVTICSLLLVVLIPAAALSQSTIFLDDFDSYAPGTYPGPPWWNMFSGVSAVVSAAQQVSSPHSLRLESYSNWARWDVVTLSLPDNLLYIFSIYVEQDGRGASVGFGFVDPGAPNTGWLANAVRLGNDGQVYFSTYTSGSTPISAWSAGHWFYGWVSINYNSMTATVSWDGNPQVSGLPADPKVLPAAYFGVEVPLNNFGAFGSNFPGDGTSVFYVDDLWVQDEGPLAIEETTWGAIKSLFAE